MPVAELILRVIRLMVDKGLMMLLTPNGEAREMTDDELGAYIQHALNVALKEGPKGPGQRSRAEVIADFEAARHVTSPAVPTAIVTMLRAIFELSLGTRDDLHGLMHPKLTISAGDLTADEVHKVVDASRQPTRIFSEEDIARARFGGSTFSGPTPVVHPYLEPTHLQRVAVLASKSAGEALTLQVGSMAMADASRELLRLLPDAKYNLSFRTVTLPNGSHVKLESGGSKIIGRIAVVFAPGKPVICPICKDPLDLLDHEKCIPF